MKARKKVSIFLLTIILLISVVTIYFYRQHQYTVETIYLDTYLELEDLDLYITSLSRYDSERNVDGYFDERQSLTRWIYEAKLPIGVKRAALRLQSFYSAPYEFYEDGRSRYVLNALVIPSNSGDPDLWQERKALIKVGLTDLASGNTRSSLSGGSTHMDSANYFTTHFTIGWPYQASEVLVITDKQDDKVVEIELKGIPVTNTYSYFNREPSRNDLIGRDPVGSLIAKYHYGQKEACQEFIHPDYLESFDWSLLDQIGVADDEVRTLNYLGADMGFDHVFALTVTDHEMDLSLKIVYDDGQWLVIGF